LPQATDFIRAGIPMPGAAVATSAIVVLLPLIPHNRSTHNDDNNRINKQEQQQHRAQPAPCFCAASKTGRRRTRTSADVLVGGL